MGWFDANDWATLAAELGLQPFLATAGYAPGMGFRQLRRTFGGPAAPPPSYAHRLYGLWRGAEVVVLTYDVGSGSTQTTYTGVLARVDPPLFLGLELRGKPPLHGLFGGESLAVGVPAFDANLVLSSFDATQTRTFFDPDDPAAASLLEGVARQVPSELLITDSVVDLSTPNTTTDPRQIAARLDQAAWLARALSERRAALPWRRDELAQRAEWEAFAQRRGYVFSPERMKLSGQENRAAVEVALETEPRGVKTSVSVRFPTPVGFGFAARRTTTPSFLQGIFGQDIRVGREPFDRLFVVTGNPEERVRELLQRPLVTDVLAELGALSGEVQMHHEGLFFRLDGGFPRGEQLEALVARGRLATTALFGEIGSLGPYR